MSRNGKTWTKCAAKVFLFFLDKSRKENGPFSLSSLTQDDDDDDDDDDNNNNNKEY